MKIFDIDSKECIEFVNKYNSKEKFINDFKSKFTHILSFHSTKLSQEELEQVSVQGLICASLKLYREKAISRFIHENDKDIIKEKIINSIDLFLKETTPYTIGEINFGLIKESLLKEYHYLKFGSEAILGLASKLRKEIGINFRTRMINYGKPYIISVNIPLEKTETIWIENIFEYLNENGLEASLVYKYNIPKELITNIKEEKEPFDVRGYEYC
ncbi:hypothetical protein [Aquimarina sp. MMG016]|uniref:hypothetical protein n=1 Tax=Aquimarina sp. MMG016 TaxID=2822690 RepID=UPI001B3A4A9F|nr:hypothetical protein [Aquimarina sp. MMG016]MBQ4822554.1 hypothetical protein [Aquimarina sp. MMG016]